jgi:hypothetical protein
MKFAHIADCHLGGWREQRLQDLNLKAFEKAIDICIQNNLDFVLITGDLFDSALPAVDILKKAAEKMRELKDADIKCYVIAGSHDYSASGKTFLDVLEKAGLCENVEKNSEAGLGITEKNDIIIAGISGRKQELEKEFVRKVKVPQLKKDKFKILALHTTLEENKTSDFVSGIKSNELPKGFDYYAMGHIHKPYKSEGKDCIIAYPGALFPNNFAELEEFGSGGFFIVNVKNKIEVEREEIRLKDILTLEFSADGKNPFSLNSEILSRLKKEDIADKIILLKIEGTLKEGKTSEVNFDSIKAASEKAFILLKNISKLKSPESKIEIEIKSDNIDEIEKLAVEKLNKDFKSMALELLKALDTEKMEGETSLTFEKRLIENISKIAGIEE